MARRYILLYIIPVDPMSDVQAIVASIRVLDPSLGLDTRAIDDVGYGMKRIKILLDVDEGYDVDALIMGIQSIDTVYSVSVAHSYII